MGMQITRRTLFAMRVVEAVAQADGMVSVATLAEVLGIKEPYANQAAYPLGKAGILATAKGPGGGYCLAKPVEEIDGSMIVRAIPKGLCPDDPEDDEVMLQWRHTVRDLTTEALRRIRFTSKGRKITR